MTVSTHRFDAIGVPWQIDTVDPLPAAVAAQVAEVVDGYDRTWSRFRDDSLVARIAREPGTWRLPAEAGPLLDLYRRLYELTDGRVSPLVGRRLESLGYDRAYSLRPAVQLAPVPRWEDALAWDGETLTTVRPVLLDVGAAGKGQLVDLMGAVLDDAGIDRWTVDASGDLAHRGGSAPGARPLRVALEHPADPTRAIGVALVTDGALCASATNRRAWGDGLHHVLDATSGLPTRGIRATWVVAPTALVADGFATAAFLAPRDRLLDLAADPAAGVEWARMRSDGRLERSPGFPAEIFTAAPAAPTAPLPEGSPA